MKVLNVYKRYGFGLILVSVFASCYTPRYAYSPTAHNVPVLTKKGDGKLAYNFSANIGTDDYGMDIQAAIALSDHWALQANYAYRREKNSGEFDFSLVDSSVIRYNRTMPELGVGYYKPMNAQKTLFFQVFGGIGFGKFKFKDDGRDVNNVYYHRFHESSVTKYFLQPAITAGPGKNFRVSLSSRFSLVRYHNIRTDYTAAELDNYKLDSLTHSPHLFWEPCIVNTFGFKALPAVKFEYQLGMAYLQTRRFIDYRSFNFSIGVMADLGVLFRRSGSPKDGKDRK